MNISIELVPRDKGYLTDSLQTIKETLPNVNTINIPDLTRLTMRSWDACSIAKSFYTTSIPHIRAIDIDPDAPLPMASCLEKHHLREVLIISGDTPQQGADEQGATSYPTTSLSLIKRFKQELPHIKVYAALDPYRHNFYAERDYVEEKIEAGADGFFTQPFFDLRLMEIYAELFNRVEIYWGIAPVLTAKSQRYWIKQNQAIFPADFQPQMDWNRIFAKMVLKFVRQTQGHVYFMPIRANVTEYLQGIL